jgi:hypothetical protein
MILRERFYEYSDLKPAASFSDLIMPFRCRYVVRRTDQERTRMAGRRYIVQGVAVVVCVHGGSY